jgi:hypothetical protein
MLGGFGLSGCGGGGDEPRESALKASGLVAQAKKAQLDPPILGCAAGATQMSVNVLVTAGATGAPSGFNLDWMPRAQHAVYGWNDELLCSAGFSGNANNSRYDLGPGESVIVNIGEFLFDNGASTACDHALECGTEYVFRAFAKQESEGGLKKSDHSADNICATLPCGNSCNYSQGYWKTHGPEPTGNNSNEWPATSLMLGSVEYTDFELLAILNAPAKGNGLLIVAHQLIAAKLNVLKNGLAPTAEMVAADALIGALVVPPKGTDVLPSAQTSELADKLRVYNEGGAEGGPGHCS